VREHIKVKMNIVAFLFTLDTSGRLSNLNIFVFWSHFAREKYITLIIQEPTWQIAAATGPTLLPISTRRKCHCPSSEHL